MKKRTTKRRKRSFITTTYREPKWLVKGRAAVRTSRRWAQKLFGVIGFATVVVVLFRLAQGGF